MLLWDVRKKNLFTVCQCVQSPEVKAEHLAQPGAGLHTSSLCQKRAALGGPGCPWLFLFHREAVRVESRSFGSDLRKPSKASWSFGEKKLPRLDVSTKKRAPTHSQSLRMSLAPFGPHSINVLMAQTGAQEPTVRKDGQTVFCWLSSSENSVDPFCR